MMVLDLRPFDTVEGVGSNELFKLVPFSNPINSRISKFSGIRPDPEKISCSRPDPIFRVLAHLLSVYHARHYKEMQSEIFKPQTFSSIYQYENE